MLKGEKTPTIQKTFRDPTPALRFIGKRYFEVDGHWGEWFGAGWFDTVETAMGGVAKPVVWTVGVDETHNVKDMTMDGIYRDGVKLEKDGIEWNMNEFV